MSHTPISAAGFPGLLSGPPEASAAWNVFSAYVMEPPVHATMSCSDHVLALQLSVTCRLRRKMHGRTLEGWSGPGMVSVIPAHTEGTWDGRGHAGVSRAIALFVPDAFLSRVIAENWDVEPKNVDIIDGFLASDPVIESLLARLALEAKHGSPSGSMYAESACEFLAHHLIKTHSSLAAPELQPAGGLPARRLKLVVDYIDENLAKRITLRRLAALAGVSARHFERAFRQAVGAPPHAYVLQKRVAAARHLLISEPALTIAEISERVGFSSSSHLAFAFRRHVGSSPTAFRGLHAGDSK